jgi:hypothetical protein
MAQPPAAGVTSVGAATITSIIYGPKSVSSGTSEVTVNGIQLKGGILAGRVRAQASGVKLALDGELHSYVATLQVGTFTGTASYCDTPVSCSSTFGPATLFDSTVVPMTGETRSGTPISGSCRGGGLTEGGVGVANTVLVTSCTATVGSTPLDPFTLVVNAVEQDPIADPLSYTGSYVGGFCTGVSASECQQSLGLSNPFPT